MSTTAQVPGPRTRSPLGHLSAFRRDPTGFLLRLARDYGDVVRFRAGPAGLYLVNNPDYIQDILVTHNSKFIKSRGLQLARRLLGNGLLTNNGESHLRQRRLIQPAFHRQRLAGYTRVMAAYADRLSRQWEDGATLDVSHEMMRLTLAIVGKTLFDADVEGEAEEIGEALTAAMGLFDRITSPFPGLLDRLPLPSNRRFEEAQRRLDAIVYRLIAERRASGHDHGDLLSMLLMAREEDHQGRHTGMTDTQIHDEALTLFLAGHETTANALAWTWYLLAQHPQITDRLCEELDAVLGDRLPVFEDVPRLHYARMVLAESMRLYPPAWVIGRQSIDSYRVGDYLLPPGSTFLMSQWVMHRDPRYYSEPERFDPQRWTPEEESSRPKFSYFPFGGGPRLCIGESFAWTEGVIVLAVLARRWRFHMVPGQAVATLPLITLRPRFGLRMSLEAREPLPALS